MEVTEHVPPNQIGYIVDASDLAGTTVTLDTVAPVTVTILSYEENPQPDDPLPATALPRYVDISVSDADAVVWPIYVEMAYTDEEAEGLDESSLGIYYWGDRAWHRCSDTSVDTGRNVVWAYMTRDEASGSPITIGATPPPRPAEFEVSDLEITPEEVEEGEEVTITATVTNIGEEEGSHTVELKIDGEVVDSEAVTLAGGASAMISFEVTRSAGTYQVEVDGLTGSFTVTAPTVAWLRPGYVAGILIVVAFGGRDDPRAEEEA